MPMLRPLTMMHVADINTRICLFSAVHLVRPPGIYLNESLTPVRRKILYDQRLLKKNENLFHSVISYNGSIYVRETSESNRKLVRSLSDVSWIV